MSSLSKITIKVLNNKTYRLKIERIHPDAPALSWLNDQSEKNIKTTLLFRTLNLLEANHKETAIISKFYEHIFSLLSPFIEEEYGDNITLNQYTELTEYGSEILENIVENILLSATPIESDINDNWEKGLIKNFNPYKEVNEGVPFVHYEITLSEPLLDNLEENLTTKVDYSSLSISCQFK
ncbi:hypothetical protein [Aureispira anguillae]|nr:hypothetical protein [Aureispira anguillae]